VLKLLVDSSISYFNTFILDSVCQVYGKDLLSLNLGFALWYFEDTLEGKAGPKSEKEENQEKLPPKGRGTLVFVVILIVFVLLGGFGGYFLAGTVMRGKSIFESPSPTPIPNSSQTEELSPTPEKFRANSISAAHNQFGFDLLNDLYKKEERNIVISPTSVAVALSMTLNGAKGTTREEMLDTLNLSSFSKEEINVKSSSMSANLKKTDGDVELSIANALWIQSDYEIKQQFLQDNLTHYEAQIDQLDFRDPKSSQIINDWVAEETKNKIKKVAPSPLPENVVMFIINAVYFNGKWTDEFDLELTEEREFSLINNTEIMVPMMKKGVTKFNYYENDIFQSVELPYGEDEQYSMYIFLPKEDLESLAEKWTEEKWQTCQDEFGSRDGTLYLPKFEIEYEAVLVDPLKNLGMTSAFDYLQADFSGINPEVYIGRVKHKTYIKVGEKGTKAAAATAVMPEAGGGGPVNPFIMEVNQPFFFLIEHQDSGEVLFTGFILNPKS